MKIPFLASMLALTFAGFAAIAAEPTAVTPTKPAADTLRAATFNIRMLGDLPPNSWDLRFPRIKKLLAALPHDIIGMQEVTAIQMDDLLTLPGWGHVGVARDDGIRKGEFSCILFRRDRLEKLAYGTFWLSETPDRPGSISWGSACRRICSWGRFRDRKTGRVFCFFNTHLDHRSKEAQTKGLELIIKRIGEIRRPGEPAIFTGDFNMGYSDPAMRQVEAVPFIDIRQAVPGGPFLDKRHTYTNYGNGYSSLIDYIFLAPPWRVVSRGLADDHSRGYASDHDLLWAELEYPPQQEENDRK